jgi:hypothetical protein
MVMSPVVFCSLVNVVEAVEPRPRFQATFLQLLDEHNQWSDSRWDLLCTTLNALQVKEVILQWSLITERPFYWRLTPERRQTVPLDMVSDMPAVKAFFDTARRRNLKVRFGLTHDPNWWGVIKNNAEIVDIYLKRIFQDQCRLADSLIDRYGSDSAFAGFYIPQEIDDETWLPADKRTILVNHLAGLNRCLTARKPGTPVAISSFANGHDDPDHYALFWRNLLHDTGIPEVYIQDGVGAGKLDIDEAALYLEAVTRQVRRVGGVVRPVVEIFQAGEGSSRPAPASMERIHRQLVSAQRICGPRIIAFSLPEYATPLAGNTAEGLFRAYKTYLEPRKD